MAYELTEFKNDLNDLGIILSDYQMKQFIDYYELLIEWNSFMNLTSITEFNEVVKKHFVDSLSLVQSGIDLNKSISIIDIGSGAGFPGIPLKIVFPNLKITLLDSLNKRIKFLFKTIEQLELVGIKAIHGRAEDFAKLDCYREQYDLCVSRAVAKLSILSEYCIPFIKIDGLFISYKSEKIIDELVEAQKVINVLGGDILKQVDFELPNSEIYRNLVLINKIKITPLKFPRKAGIPSKEPII